MPVQNGFFKTHIATCGRVAKNPKSVATVAKNPKKCC